jgi:hypothetical protein
MLGSRPGRDKFRPAQQEKDTAEAPPPIQEKSGVEPPHSKKKRCRLKRGAATRKGKGTGLKTRHYNQSLGCRTQAWRCKKRITQRRLPLCKRKAASSCRTPNQGRDTFRAALHTKERKGKGTGLKTRHYKSEDSKRKNAERYFSTENL